MQCTRLLNTQGNDNKLPLIEEGMIDIGREYWEDKLQRQPVVRYERDGFRPSKYNYLYRVIVPTLKNGEGKTVREEGVDFWIGLNYWKHQRLQWMTGRHWLQKGITNLGILLGFLSIAVSIYFGLKGH